jgi:hypothetical protein
VESGLREAPLAEMEVTLVRQQAVSEDEPRALERAPLQEVFLVGDQDIADEIRMIEEDEWLAADSKAADVAVFGGALGEDAEGVTVKAEKEVAGESRMGAGGGKEDTRGNMGGARRWSNQRPRSGGALEGGRRWCVDCS